MGAEQPLGRKRPVIVLSSNGLEGHGEITPFSTGFWRVAKFGANLVILAQKRDELLRGQARFWPIWAVLTPNDLEGQGQSTPFSIGFWRVPRYTFGAQDTHFVQIC